MHKIRFNTRVLGDDHPRGTNDLPSPESSRIEALQEYIVVEASAPPPIKFETMIKGVY